MTAAQSLVSKAAECGATDLHVTWNGAGRVIMKRHGVALQSWTPPGVDVLCRQLLVMGGLDPLVNGTLLPVRLGSFQGPSGQVRVISMQSIGSRGQTTYAVHLRLHAPGALDRAQASLDEFEGLREMLERPSGLLVIAGPACSGKTTFLGALMRNLVNRMILVASECEELDVPDGTPCFMLGTDYDAAYNALLRFDGEAVVIDEGVEAEKVRLALRLAPTHLTLLTLKAPNLAGAVHMLRLGVMEAHRQTPGTGVYAAATQHQTFASTMDGRYYAEILGILRTHAGDTPPRWIPFLSGHSGTCPYCGAFRPPGTACPGCGSRQSPSEYSALSMEMLGSWPAGDVMAFCHRLESHA